MRIKLLKSVKDSRGWHDPGTILDFDDDDARSLIRSKVAEEFVEEIVDENDKEISEEDLENLAKELCKINGINDEIAYRLIEAGFGTIQAIAEADPKDLIKIKGIGKKTVSDIQDSAEDLFDDSHE